MKTKNEHAKRRGRSSTPRRLNPRQIAFRLGESDSKILADRATEEGRSHHLMAQDLVVAALHKGDDLQEVTEKIEMLRGQLFELREELSLVAEVLLANAGKASPAEASEWVDSNLKPDPEFQ